MLFTYSIPSNIIIKERKKVRASEVLSVKHCESLDQWTLIRKLTKRGNEFSCHQLWEREITQSGSLWFVNLSQCPVERRGRKRADGRKAHVNGRKRQEGGRESGVHKLPLMNIITYNVRGLGKGVKGAAIRRLIYIYKKRWKDTREKKNWGE